MKRFKKLTTVMLSVLFLCGSFLAFGSKVKKNTNAPTPKQGIRVINKTHSPIAMIKERGSESDQIHKGRRICINPGDSHLFETKKDLKSQKDCGYYYILDMDQWHEGVLHKWSVGVVADAHATLRIEDTEKIKSRIRDCIEKYIRKINFPGNQIITERTVVYGGSPADKLTCLQQVRVTPGAPYHQYKAQIDKLSYRITGFIKTPRVGGQATLKIIDPAPKPIMGKHL